MHERPKTSVVILNYNTREQLEEFIPRVTEHSPKAEVVVVDNGSMDGSVAYMEKHPDVRLIQLDRNHGFCGGYNRGLSQIEAEYYVLLNSDVEVTPGWLDPLVKLLDENPQIGAVQPKVLAYHDKAKFEYAGAAGGFIDRLGYPFCRGRLFDQVEKDEGQYKDTVPVFWATGACMVIRSELYHRFGGLDEEFFAHMEEIDLCWRMRQAGHLVYACGESKVYHVGGGTLAAVSPFKTFLNFRNGLMLLYKNLPSKQLFPKIFIRMVLDGVAGLKFIMEGKPILCWQIFKAHLAFYGKLPYLRKARRKHGFTENQRVKALSGEGYLTKLLIREFFLKGKKKSSEL
jgi:GT2 family glycosyltransferase